MAAEATLVEEQRLPGFYKKRFYPVTIGQKINDRYRVVAKMGYGAYSTVWLAHDEVADRYAALKIFIRDDFDDSDGSPVKNELKILRHLANRTSEHPGASYVRQMEDNFQLDGHHECIVMKPAACSLQHLSNIYGSNSMPSEMLVTVVATLLYCLNWCQLESCVVHTDISAQNILLTCTEDTVFRRAEQDELDNPTTPIIDSAHPYPHPIYRSRVAPANLFEAAGGVLLNDFGSARIVAGTESTRGWSMPDTYRAPEVLMDLPWAHGVDIWSIGIMLLELVEGRNVFNPIVDDKYVLSLAMAQYIGYMGLPPLWMIQKSENPAIAALFDTEGRWAGGVPIPTTRFEDFLTVFPPGEGEAKAKFLTFIRRILTWDPFVRAHTVELLEDEWITAPLKANGYL